MYPNSILNGIVTHTKQYNGDIRINRQINATKQTGLKESLVHIIT